MVYVLYRHGKNLRQVSPQNWFPLKEFETTTGEIGLIIFPFIPCHWGRRRKRKRQYAERRAERDSNILFYNTWVFDIFVLLLTIIMQYLYDSVYMLWKFGFPLRHYAKIKLFNKAVLTALKSVLKITAVAKYLKM